MIRRDGIVYCYIDNVEIGNFQATGSAGTTDNIIFGDVGLPYIGNLKNVSYWNRALSYTELSNLCNNTMVLQGDEFGLVAYWKFNEKSGSIFYDSTGNGHDGTMSGNYTWEDWLPDATQSIQYDYNFSATGSMNTPYTFDLYSGSLQSGLNLDSDGLLSGIPSEAGEFYFVISATDSIGCVGMSNTYQLLSV